MSEQTDLKNRVEELFHEAQARPSQEARAAYLDGACEGDPELRAEVEALISAGRQADSYLEKPPVMAETISSSGDPSEGSEVGNYKLLQQLGEGGFGIVYMAQQTRPIKRQVAIKIIKPGMDSKEVIARFEAERQALAMMDHPNIAKVLDAGTTSHGRPYFVMELVKGRPITEYCDANQLSTEDRLHLFIQVCNAVQHAHQKGVIHRDLKPSNVMVTLHDGKPVPKVIDFGVSKALSHQLTDKTLFTRYGQIIGTPQYMSPEQAEMSGLDIDTRSDIYSLGVLLYELLTGQTPFDNETLRKAGLEGMRKLICESEPCKPSTRVKTLAGESATLVANHRSSPATDALSRLFTGDLDWIVMKSLDKDRSRRYETANSFVQDIERHLADKPVQAGPPSLPYQLSKLYRRHRGVFLTASATACMLLVSVGVSLAGWFAAAQARDEANAASLAAQRNERKAIENAVAARTSQQQAEQERDKFKQSLDLATEVIRRTAKLFKVDEAEEYLSSTLKLLRDSDSNPIREVEILTVLGEVHGQNNVAATKFAKEACVLTNQLSAVQKGELNRNPFLLYFTLLGEQDLPEAVDMANQAVSFAESHLGYSAQLEAIRTSAKVLGLSDPALSLEYLEKAAAVAMKENDVDSQWAVWELSMELLRNEFHMSPYQQIRDRAEKVESVYKELTHLQGIKKRMLPNRSGCLAAMLLALGKSEEANTLLDSDLTSAYFHKNFGETAKDLGELAMGDDYLRRAGSINEIWVPIDRARGLVLGRKYPEAIDQYQRGLAMSQDSKDRNKIWTETWLRFELASVKSLLGEKQNAVFRQAFEILNDADNLNLYGTATLPITLLAGTWGGCEIAVLEPLSEKIKERNLRQNQGKWMDIKALAEFELRKGNVVGARDLFVASKATPNSWLAGMAFSDLVEEHVFQVLQQEFNDVEELSLLESDIAASDRDFAPNHPKRAFTRIRYLQAVFDDHLGSQESRNYLAEAQRIFDYQGEWVAEAERKKLANLTQRLAELSADETAASAQ